MTFSRNWKFYEYKPSSGAAIFFIIAFIVVTGIFSWQTWITGDHAKKISQDPFLSGQSVVVNEKERKLYSPESMINAFIPFFIGCALEIVGYICRAKSATHVEKLSPYIIQSIFILVAPSFFAATIYIIFGRLLYYMGSQTLMIIPYRFFTTFFVMGDVIGFIMQDAGGGLLAVPAARKIGSVIIIIGLFIQVSFFFFFVFIEVRFTKLVGTACPFYNSISKKWWFVNVCLLISSLLIFFRSIIRIIESIQGYDGYLASHEYFLYVFDALPMFLVVASFSIFTYFGSILDVMIECQQYNQAPSETSYVV